MKDAYWFKHDSNARNDEKIIDLRTDLGYEGYGIFWALIEFLRDTESYEAEYKPKRLAMAIQAEESLIEQVINSYGLFVVDDQGKFYSKSLKVRMEAMDKKREQQRNNANKRWAKEKEKSDPDSNNAMALPSQSHKNRIEQKRIENNKKEHRKGNERVQGEKGKGKACTNFIVECQEIKNVYPITLLCEYLLFYYKCAPQLAKSTIRENFKEHLKTIDFSYDEKQTKLRMKALASMGFDATKEQIEREIERFVENQKGSLRPDQILAEFLAQLNENTNLKANSNFKEFVRPFFKIQ